MSYIIVNKHDGTVVGLDGSYIINTLDLSPEGQQLMAEWDESGSDSIVAELAEHGKELKRVLGNCGFGDLNYGNSIAFSPEGLREEFQAKLDSGVWDDDPVYQRALKFTDEELEAFGSYILGNDYIWNVYNEEINHNLRPFIAEVLNEEIK